jgi:hypothetical protein
VKARALIADDEPHLAANLRERLQALWPDLEIRRLPPTASRLCARSPKTSRTWRSSTSACPASPASSWRDGSTRTHIVL